MNYLSLFSGIGGFELGMYRAGIRCESHYFSEVNGYACSVYKKNFPEVAALGDIRKIEGKNLPRGKWIFTGGFPCQDLSVAGKKAGLEGSRSGLFSECVRLIGEVRPRYAVMENVANLASWFDAGKGRLPQGKADMEGDEREVETDQYQGIARCIGRLSEIGYDSEWAVVRASDVGAPHPRARIWIVAYPYNRDAHCVYETEEQKVCGGAYAKPIGVRQTFPDSPGKKPQNPVGFKKAPGLAGFADGGSDVPDPDASEAPRQREHGGEIHAGPEAEGFNDTCGGWWSAEPGVGRVAYGIPNRLDRLRCLGASLVPQIAELIFLSPCFDEYRSFGKQNV